MGPGSWRRPWGALTAGAFRQAGQTDVAIACGGHLGNSLPGGTITDGAPADLTVIDLNRPHVIDSGSFRSLGRATPFDGWGVSCAVAMTICGGKIVYHDLNTQEDAL